MVATTQNRLLEKMLDRLYAAMSNGPALNCRPHASRQRVDLSQLGILEGAAGEGLLARMLGDEAGVRLSGHARALEEKRRDAPADPEIDPQRQLFKKLRTIADDARTYEQDTGAQVLFVGYPLLQLPPRKGAGGAEARRVLAPVAFIPVRLTLKLGSRPAVHLELAGEGAELVIPNPALFAWIEQQTGARLPAQSSEEAEAAPWEELRALTARACEALELPAPIVAPEQPLTPVAKGDAPESQERCVLASAVLGLFPLGNQNVVEDTKAMLGGEALEGPVQSFLQAGVALAHEQQAGAAEGADAKRLVTAADPCQARAVRLARRARGLVIHGPPGTGKSQTIANVIGDHLARGERVLFVCDKRGALDVVHHRLSRLGLVDLCAIVHDARRDQRDLYLGIRAQLDGLPETKVDDAVEPRLRQLDAELLALHGELGSHLQKLGERPAPGSKSFHELTGEWLGIRVADAVRIHAIDLGTLAPEELDRRQHELRELFERAAQCAFPENPWCRAAGLDLQAYLAEPVAHWRAALATTVEAVRHADGTRHATILPFSVDVDLAAQGKARSALAETLASLTANANPERIEFWAGAGPAKVGEAATQLRAMTPHVEVLRRGPLDPELVLSLQPAPPLAQVNADIAELEAYLAIAAKWYRPFCFGKNGRAEAVLKRFGLALSAANAERVKGFLEGIRARQLLGAVLTQLAPELNGGLAENTLAKAVEDHLAIFAALGGIAALPELGSIASQLRAALAKRAHHPALIEGLRRSELRSASLVELQQRMVQARLFLAAFMAGWMARLAAGDAASEEFAALERGFGTLETVLRLEGGLRALPQALASATRGLLERHLAFDECWPALRKAALAGELARRIRQDPALQLIDGDRLQAGFERYRALEAERTALVQRLVQQRWTARQRERLLASTGGRLNAAGAELRRRLFLRGERALKVRQVIAAGARTEGGDPLFDVRPVWMASPATVAQIFPRAPIFDVVIFDEASQCRLEEALPVLTRAKRLVIAGDPKQLPPTRFFESAVVQNVEDDAESDQELFEAQQSEVEDLLTAALHLEIEQCYLDVHYRSSNADLIAFSNDSFYERRLQPIPGHPSRLSVDAPIRLQQVAGTYEKRVNAAEAEAVVAKLKELLAQPKPPSIGVACFNLAQRDAINEAIERAASEEPGFARQLAEARVREGAGSFEGLFVKNLENVQGDERDHLIISTTYGPDAKGRFYRRFGPLGMAGGGRRLNVLVTRAREAIHLITSIPPEAYRAVPPVPAGQTPNGAWLLMSYLAFAEHLERLYRDGAVRPETGPKQGEAQVRETPYPSRVAQGLAMQLAADFGLSSEVHWGNPGFCVDIAIHHPELGQPGVLGLLCDGSRYDKAGDALEWDLFQTQVLETQGWKLHRLWSPHVFRDLETTLARVVENAAPRAAPETENRIPASRVVH